MLKITVRVDRIRFRVSVLGTMGRSNKWKTKQVVKTHIVCSEKEGRKSSHAMRKS